MGRTTASAAFAAVSLFAGVVGGAGGAEAQAASSIGSSGRRWRKVTGGRSPRSGRGTLPLAALDERGDQRMSAGSRPRPSPPEEEADLAEPAVRRDLSAAPEPLGEG